MGRNNDTDHFYSPMTLQSASAFKVLCQWIFKGKRHAQSLLCACPGTRHA
jgi:hypothetical protein